MSDSAVERRNSLPERQALTPEQLALKRQFAQDLRERARRRLPNSPLNMPMAEQGGYRYPPELGALDAVEWCRTVG